MFRIMTGIVFILAAIVLLYFAIVESLIMLIHAGVIGGLGLAILLNKKEDEIEEINNANVKNKNE